jgi:predicted Ser/Thr protein kinase
MGSEVTELISALRNGTISLDEVAQRFRERSWSRRNTEKSATYLDLAAAAERDPDPYLEGSFDEVAMAFHRGELSDSEYETLAQAMADSMRREDTRKDPQN